MAVPLLVVVYLLSFFPACWALMRTDSTNHPIRWEVLRALHSPTAFALRASPSTVREWVFAAVDRMHPVNGWKIYENWDAGLGVGMYRTDHAPDGDPVITDIRLW